LIDITLALLLGGGIIVIGFLSNLLFEHTGFPDMLFLIVLGIILGPVLGLFEPTSIMNLAPYIAALALVFILFDGGMKMNIYHVVSESPRAVTLAVSGFTFSVITVSLFMFFFADVPTLYAILFGTIYGGSSSVAVVSLVSKIKMSEKCSTILALESTITDVLCIVFSLAIIDIILTGQMDYSVVGKLIAGRFAIGAVVGVLFGALWLAILRRTNRTPYAYMLTLAAVLLAYASSEWLGGSGALCSLLFGILLGNEKQIHQMLRLKSKDSPVVDEGLKRFESEIAFLIRSFFFVYLGLIASINSFQAVILGVILTLLLLLVRYGGVSLATFHSELREERSLMWIVLTRGLAAAVLATLPMQYAAVDQTFAELAPIYINTAVIIIISTAIVCTVGSVLYRTRKSKV
jgi:cell volume regulation protein A